MRDGRCEGVEEIRSEREQRAASSSHLPVRTTAKSKNVLFEKKKSLFGTMPKTDLSDLRDH